MPTPLETLGKINRDVETNTRAKEFANVARWLMVGKGNLGNAIHEAQAHRATEKILTGLKVAVAAGSTGDANFAAPLAYQELADGFLVSLRNIGVFDAALPFAVDVPLNTQVAVTTTGVTAASIGEGQVKGHFKNQSVRVGTDAKKSCCDHRRHIGIAPGWWSKGRTFVSTGVVTRYRGRNRFRFLSVISTGITPTASSGSNAAAIAVDMGALLGALSLGVGSKVFIAMSPGDVKHFAIQVSTTGAPAFPGMTINGGDYCGCTVIPTDALSGSIIAFDASQLAMGSTGLEIDASNWASVQMDTAPDSPPSASSNMVSLWQLNQTGLRATRYFGCERLRSTAVSAISNVSWGSANSPA